VTQFNNTAGHEQQIPAGYSPRVARMGDASRKVFCADGARFSTTTTVPDYDLTAAAAWGGTFSDVGPYSMGFTRSWDRGRLFNATGAEARSYAFRHSRGIYPPGAAADAFKMNVLFYDTHVELMGDLESASPYMWLPARWKFVCNNTYPDVLMRFGLSAGQTININ
jgi:prepilin-type processing-associated H-X9-DG protein